MQLHRSNREYIERVIPDVAALMCDFSGEVVQDTEIIVIDNGYPEIEQKIRNARPDQTLIDLVNILKGQPDLAAQYEDIRW